MSTSIHDIIEREKFSNCCSSSMYELGDNYICTDCKEWCEAIDEDTDRVFSNEQLAEIAKKEKECADANCEGTDHKCTNL